MFPDPSILAVKFGRFGNNARMCGSTPECRTRSARYSIQGPSLPGGLVVSYWIRRWHIFIGFESVGGVLITIVVFEDFFLCNLLDWIYFGFGLQRVVSYTKWPGNFLYYFGSVVLFTGPKLLHQYLL